MPPSNLGPLGYDEADEGIARKNGKAFPQRSRLGSATPKMSKSRTSRVKRKPSGPNGIHNRRNKRMSW